MKSASSRLNGGLWRCLQRSGILDCSRLRLTVKCPHSYHSRYSQTVVPFTRYCRSEDGSLTVEEWKEVVLDR